MEVGADRELVLRICPRYRETVKITCVHRKIIGQRQLDSATGENIRLGWSSEAGAEAGGSVGDRGIREGDTRLAQALDVAGGSRPAAQTLDGDFGPDQHKFEARIDAEIGTHSELRPANRARLSDAIDAGIEAVPVEAGI